MRVTRERSYLIPFSTVYLGLMLLLVSLPGLFLNYLDVSSMMPGVLVTMGCIFLYSLYNMNASRIYLEYIIALTAVFVFLILHQFVCMYLYDDLNGKRFTESLLLLLFMGYTSCLLARFSFGLNEVQFDKVIFKIYYFLLLIGYISIPFVVLQLVTRKSMFLFSEPSHYAITFAPFLCYVTERSSRATLHLLLCLLMVVLLQSMTLMAVLLISVYFSNRRRGISNILFGISLLAPAAIAYALFNDYLGYFVERLIFTSSSDNLSVLALLSGYERAYLGLFDNLGLGVGFQQMGVVGQLGEIQEKLNELGVAGLNLFDGGAFVSKIVVEFGLFGLAVILAYIVGFFYIRRHSKRYGFTTVHELFYCACYISFSIVLFFRGASYFTPSFLLFLCSLYGIYLHSKYRFHTREG